MKPNILFIMTDQQSASMMSCTGNTHLETPALDYLSNNGVRFERAYCTNPVCMPSRFSIFTGKMPSYINLKNNNTAQVNHKKINNLLNQGIGYLMKDAGYHAVYGGKEHLPEFQATDLGFDILSTNERDNLAEECASFIKQKKDKPFFLTASFINPHDICYMAIRDFASSESSKNIIKKGKTELSNVDKFLHSAIDGGADFVNEHCPPLPKNYMPQQDEPEAINQLIKSKIFRLEARENYTDNDWRMHRYVYHKLTEMVDKQIGIVLRALKESNQEDNTVIIFTSDHGDMDGAHKLEHKIVFYDEASRIPLLIYQKGVTLKGVVNDTHLISNGLDLIPTLCDYAGIKAPKDLEGKSFRSIAEGKDKTILRKAVKLESEIGKMIITHDYKYAKFDMGHNNEQLYDLKNDPGETKNSALISGNKDVLNVHKRLFKEMFLL